MAQTHTHGYIITYVHMVYTACTYNRNAKRCDNEKYLVFYYKYQRRLRPAPKPQQQQQHIRSASAATPSHSPLQNCLCCNFRIVHASVSETVDGCVWVSVAELLRIQAQKIARNINTIRRERRRRWNGEKVKRMGNENGKTVDKPTNSIKKCSELGCFAELLVRERDEINIMQPAGQQLLSRFSCKNSFNMTRRWEEKEGEKFVIYFFNWN